MNEPRRVLAVASGGGHWVQLMRLRPALDGCVVIYASSREQKPREIESSEYRKITEANRDTPFLVLRTILDVIRIVRATRPDTVITTGAAPGAIAMFIGRMVGARTIWIDSIANVQRLSLSGRLVAPVADYRLTQWEHLARPKGPEYRGAII